ncbi:MAG: hypothetical protein U0556_18850 [Dehalococcoidia bacterium]
MIQTMLARRSPFAFVRALKGRTEQTILANASSVVGTMGVTSLLGYAYWWIAARLFDPAAVGLATALISAITLLGMLSALGLGTLLVGEVARRPSAARPLILAAVLVTSAAAGLVALLFVALAPLAIGDFAVLRVDPIFAGMFVAGAVGTTAALLLDQSVVGLLRGELQFVRNTVFSVVKLVLLVPCGTLLVSFGAASVFGSWVVGIPLSFLVFLPFLMPPRTSLRAVGGEVDRIRRLAAQATGHHVLNLALLAPALVLPLIVTSVLSAEMNAYFYIAWIFANLVFAIPGSLATTLYAVAAKAPDELGGRLRFSLVLSAVVGVAGTLGILVVGPLLLGWFGAGYREIAGVVLTLLVFGVFPLILKDHYIAVRRVEQNLGRAALVIAAGTVVELSGALIGVLLGGLPGLAIGWVLGVVIEAAVMTPTLVRTMRRPITPIGETS